MCHEASFPQCVLAAQSGRRPDYTVQVLEAALEAQDPLIEFAAAYDRTDSIAEFCPPGRPRRRDCGSGDRSQSVDRRAHLALAAVFAGVSFNAGDLQRLRRPQASRSDQPISATAAAAPMANMQISWMENSVKRTLTTALVWRSAT